MTNELAAQIHKELKRIADALEQRNAIDVEKLTSDVLYRIAQRMAARDQAQQNGRQA